MIPVRFCTRSFVATKTGRGCNKKHLDNGAGGKRKT
ncbi:hypothetical protein BMS3Abin10_02249 [bacterium BMS3Abin10]|nr:hypothetical protein BMS3Abin10_02249 [bacterium BMS3Abin10]GBE38501.1 hypothetical protein BMS3Bbin08_01108 [bacterium BMS3Bbin08]